LEKMVDVRGRNEAINNKINENITALALPDPPTQKLTNDDDAEVTKKTPTTTTGGREGEGGGKGVRSRQTQ
jgi:hypothetical protein